MQDKFNQIMDNIENEHVRNGTEVNHDGEIVFVDTPWACGFIKREDDA